MQYLDTWQKDLNRRKSLFLIILFIFLFIFYIWILFFRLSASRYFNTALGYLEKAESLDKDIIIEKSLSYQKALKFFTKAMRLNPYDARLYFEYAQAITEIGKDLLLSSSIEIKSLDSKQNERLGFYNLAKEKYTEALFREPTNAFYHIRLGYIYDNLSNQIAAESEFNKAVLLDPQNIRILLYLSRYFLSKNKKDIALTHLNKAVSLYKVLPRGPISDEVENFLKRIQE